MSLLLTIDQGSATIIHAATSPIGYSRCSSRGINKSKLFDDEQDKARFLERLGKHIVDGKCSIYAWVLMDNHVHLLFKSGELGISSVMRKLLTWYAQYFNRCHNRTGHLFENRYKSILCEEGTYLLALVRYIHLNPVRAGIVSTLEQLDHYPWSGHSTLMGIAAHNWMDRAYVLGQFGERTKSARNAYRRFIAQGMNMGRVPELTGGGLIRSKGGWSQVISVRRHGKKEEADERILGGSDFINSVLKEAEEKTRCQLKMRRSGKTITTIIKEECKKEGVSVFELQNGSRRRKVSALREKIAKRGLSELGATMAEIARQVGVNTSSIAKALARNEER